MFISLRFKLFSMTVLALALPMLACGGSQPQTVQQVVVVVTATPVPANGNPPPADQQNNSQPEQPVDTATPLTPPTADTSILFIDDFEEGIKPDWQIKGDNFSSTNGSLSFEGLLEANVGDSHWINYTVEINGMQVKEAHGGRVIVRRQDNDNYMAFRCIYDDSSSCVEYRWVKVVNGEEKDIPQATFYYKSRDTTITIEITGNGYKTIVNGEQVSKFFDDTFKNGGIGLFFKKNIVKIDSITVTALP
jgi:hypothetical protein